MGKIKGQTKAVRKFGVDTLMTFSNEDLSVSVEYVAPITEVMKEIRFPRGRFITSFLVKELKQDGKYIQMLKDMAERVPKALELYHDDQVVVTIRLELYEDGVLNFYCDDKLLFQEKESRDWAIKRLRDIRKEILKDASMGVK